MKKILLGILILLPLLESFSQTNNDFKESNEYDLTEIDSIVAENYWNNNTNKTEPILRYLKNQDGKIITKFDISELEFYSGSSIKVLSINNLKNITQIIHLQSSYDACCTNYYSNYFLKTENGKLIELPEVEYLHCDGPTPIKELRFPNQKFGKKNQILLTKSTLNKDYKVESVEIIKTYFWDGEKIILEK
tara:strand:- start:17 stop:589 length:573 start_codon:yes stop_codon:yes gene_type:complete